MKFIYLKSNPRAFTCIIQSICHSFCHHLPHTCQLIWCQRLPKAQELERVQLLIIQCAILSKRPTQVAAQQARTTCMSLRARPLQVQEQQRLAKSPEARKSLEPHS